ncbi:MAG: FeoB-associated Cys-rich membrane protein [Lachnospiraceae bacterium]|nr:FeoB-associated Cys-rich membrane protein [Lachnospiraceae bacterium]MDD6504218.1 FeoB-associated Cys-rich membrane protein [Lachnospiraceae bacterium]
MVATIIISIALIVIVAFIIRGMIRNVKNGKGLDGGCSGNCSKCGRCH